MADAATHRHLNVIGVDHHRTPVALRERLALAAPAAGKLAASLITAPGIDEAVILSTCNRLECYYSGNADRSAVLPVLAQHHDITLTDLDHHAFSHHDDHCIRHLFRVVSGLESLVLGEYQIVHQVKTAYEQARQTGTTGPFLNPLFQRALAVAKDVRNRTAIGKHKLSVASVAVDLAKQVHGDLSQARLLIIGAGEIAELAMQYLINAGVQAITVINRSEDHAHDLASHLTNFKPAILPWSQLTEALADHDIVVSSTAAPHTVVTVAQVRQALRKRKEPLVFLDVAVPRDIDPSVGQLQDVFLYNIDHLDAVVAANRHLRSEDLDAAQAVITEHLTSYLTDTRHERSALLAQVASYFQDITSTEEARLFERLGITNVNQQQELRYGLERIGNKLQHRLLAYVRQNPLDTHREQIIKDILGL